MLLITSGLKVDERVLQYMLFGKVRVLNRDNLKEMLDNRPEWWIRFYQATLHSQTKKETFKSKILRKHQQECANAIMACKEKKGKIILPTGSGKTLIESEVIYQTILICQKGGMVPVIKVNSPRILLCFQLFREIMDYLQAKGISARYINFNSGKGDEKWYSEQLRKRGDIYREMTYTTKPEEVVSQYDKAKRDNLPLIIFSTYHSSVKCAESKIIPSLTIHDEAHNLVATGFTKATNPELCPSDSSFFFTATEKVTDSDEDLGMNNPEIFGEMIYFKSPLEMITAGEMVPPLIHVVRAKKGIKFDLNKMDRDYEAMARSIFEALVEHKKKIKECSWQPDEIGAKILVICRGQIDLMEMMSPSEIVDLLKNKVFEVLRKEHPELHLYALSSDYGVYNDGEFLKAPVNNVKKDALMDSIRNLPSNADALIFHVDMIGEGIDVAGITGVMPFRNCDLAKFIQNVGRAARLHAEDRKRLYAGTLFPTDQDRNIDKKWIKPYSWIIIPSFLENAEGFQGRFRDIVSTLRSQYGYIPQQETLIDNVKGFDPDEPPPYDNEITKNSPHSHSGLDEFDHEFEALGKCDQVLEDMSIEDELAMLEEQANKGMGLVKSDPAGVLFTMKTSGTTATMKMTGSKFIILAGSGVNEKESDDLANGNYSNVRKRLIKNGFIKDWVVVKDIECESPGYAGAVLLGYRVNGKTYWKDSSGREIGEYMS
jgi:superfamily II DNA or RNA helicase